MSSISHAISAVDASHETIRIALKSGAKISNEDEAREARTAKAKAMRILNESLSAIDLTLAKYQCKAAKDQRQLSPSSKTLLTEKHPPGTNLSTSVKLRAMASDPNSKINNLRNTMSANKSTDPSKPTMADAVPTLQDMAGKLGPIIDDFTSVLQKPYLNQFNATLNTVPVVGIKDQTIMYIGTKPNPTPLSPPIDSWAVFGNLPDGVTVTPTDNIHFFPYNADFYMSIGQKVWMRKHRQGAQPGSEPDPVLKQAVDNWPKLYEDTWQFIGDTALPAGDVKSVVPFTTLSASRDAIGFHLAILTSAGTLQFLDADVLQGSNNAWTDLKFVSNDAASSQPAWTSFAYWNNQFVGLDDSQNFWNLTPDWPAHQYTVGDQTKIPEPITELTATEQGPVGVRADGTLWKRLLDPPKDSQDSGSYAWKSWIKQNGVTHLGVASPGVLLDLNLLTSTLLSRYIETQTAVVPLMNKIRAYGMTHTFYLKTLSQAAQDYQNADTDAKAALAIKNGKSYVVHAKTWAKILGVAANHAKEPVNIMTGQLTNVEAQLVTQLSILKDKLTGLQASLKAEKEYLSQLQAAFWGSIAALLLSVAVALIGVATMNPWIIAGAGVLFVAGLTCAIVFGTKMGQAAADVASTQAQIDTTQTAINQLTDVVNNFQTISDLYGVLNTFFGRMSLDASALADMDDATAEQLGSDVLDDTSSIDAAAAMTDQMTAACGVYLDTLSKQRIHLPSDDLVHSLMSDTSNAHAPAVKLHLKAQALNGSFHHTLRQAHTSLTNGDIPTYLKTMDRVATINEKAIATDKLSVTASGRWFDMAALSNSGSIWSGFSNTIGIQAMSLSANPQTISQSSTVDGGLDQVRPLVVGFVQETLQLAETCQEWAAKYPEAPKGDDDASAQAYQDKAVNACQAAQSKAKDANNSFNDFNTRAHDFYNSCEAQINMSNSTINIARAGAASEIANLSPPFYMMLDPTGIAASQWRRSHADDINNRLNQTVSNLNTAIQNLRQLENSGTNFQGNTMTWKVMVETVSASLFDIFSMLTGVEGQLMEDPNLYKQLMSFEWAQLAQDAKTTLTILGVHSPEGSLMALTSSKSSAMHMTRFASGRRAPTTELSDNAKFVSALSSNSTLGTKLSSQAAQCNNAFNQLNQLLAIPALADIVGYWDESKVEKATLKEVTQKLKNEYVSVISMQYGSVEKLYSLSILQGVRAKNARAGKLPMKIFVNNTLDSLRAAMKASQAANTVFQANNAEFQKVVTLIQNNIDEIEKRIAGLDTQIDTADKQLRDKIINEIADVVAIAFATGALLISFGVIGPGTAAVMGLGAKLAASAAVIAASTKLVLDSLSIDDLIKFIAGLKSTKSKLQDSVDDLKKVQPFFRDIVEGVGAITETVEDMTTSVQHVYDDLTLWQVIALTGDDVTTIQKSWDELRDDCLIWMDMVHAQNINPMTASQFR